MDPGAALVAIVVALIAAGFGFAGGYYGARWQAHANLAQWQRDQLLKFSVDLVSVGREISLKLWKREEPYPYEQVHRIDDAVAGILLLGGEALDKLAFSYQSAVLDALNEQLGVSNATHSEKPPIEAAVETEAQFLWRAHNLLLGKLPNPARWERSWQALRSRLSRLRRKNA